MLDGSFFLLAGWVLTLHLFFLYAWHHMRKRTRKVPGVRKDEEEMTTNE
jgi:hypothetical protein